MAVKVSTKFYWNIIYGFDWTIEIALAHDLWLFKPVIWFIYHNAKCTNMESFLFTNTCEDIRFSSKLIPCRWYCESRAFTRYNLEKRQAYQCISIRAIRYMCTYKKFYIQQGSRFPFCKIDKGDWCRPISLDDYWRISRHGRYKSDGQFYEL